MKRKIIFGIFILVVLVGIISYVVINTDNSDNNSSSDDSSMNTNIDFENATSSDIVLNDQSIKITKGGVYNISGTLSDGQILIDTLSDVKLVLNNVSINNSSGPAIYVSNADNVYIEIIGENSVSSTTTDSLGAAIYSSDDLLLMGSGSIKITSNFDGIASSDDLVIEGGTYIINVDDDALRGKDSLTINDGEFSINSKGDAIKTTSDENKGSLIINNGTFTINSLGDGIDSVGVLTINNGTFDIKSGNGSNSKPDSVSLKGIKSDNNVVINGGTFTIDSQDDSIHSNASIYINKGEFILSSGDDGIHSDYDLNIKNSTIKVSKSYEGLEAYNIVIESGNISVVASDDGINVNNGNDSSGNDIFRGGIDQDSGGKLTINGGNVYINASGDGLDSNGSMYINGGSIFVDGPTNNGNGALDYNGECIISGGELFAVGSSGMAQNVSSSSTQTTIMINLSSTYSGDIKLGDISISPSKSYSSIVISSFKLSAGNTYTLEIDGNVYGTYKLTSTVSQVGNLGQGMGDNRRMR